MLAASKLMGFVPTRDSLKDRAFYEDKTRLPVRQRRPFRSRHELRCIQIPALDTDMATGPTLVGSAQQMSG